MFYFSQFANTPVSPTPLSSAASVPMSIHRYKVNLLKEIYFLFSYRQGMLCMLYVCSIYYRTWIWWKLSFSVVKEKNNQDDDGNRKIFLAISIKSKVLSTFNFFFCIFLPLTVVLALAERFYFGKLQSREGTFIPSLPPSRLSSRK